MSLDSNTKKEDNVQKPESFGSNVQYDPNNITIKYTKPLDVYFERLTAILRSIVKDPNASIKETTTTLPMSRPEILYNSLSKSEIQEAKEHVKNFGKNGPYPQTVSFTVIAFFCQSLLKIRKLIHEQHHTQEEEESSDKKDGKEDHKDMIKISLNDMKIFNTILNIIIIDGIYPCLSPGVGVPLNLRIKNKQSLQATSTLIGNKWSTTTECPPTQILKFAQLSYILDDTLIPCLQVNDDVRNLIFIGSYFPDLLTVAAELAFNPAIIRGTSNTQAVTKPSALKNFQFIVGQMDTYSLFLNLTSFIRPKAPIWIITAASRILATLPLVRPRNGVLSLIDFISGAREKPDINIADLDKAVKILKSVPAKMDTSIYYKKIGKQLISILAIQTRPTLVSSTVHILSSLYEQKREMIINGVQNSLIETLSPYSLSKRNEPDTPKDNMILVNDTELTEALDAFTSLLRSAQPLEVIHEIGKLCFVSLWSLLCYVINTKKASLESVKSIVIAVISLQPEDQHGIQSMLVRNFLEMSGSKYWEFGSSDSGGVEIRQTLGEIAGSSFESKNNTISPHSKPKPTESLLESLVISKSEDENENQIKPKEEGLEDEMKNLESQLKIFGEISERTKILSEHILKPLQEHFIQINTKDTFTSSLFVYLIKEWLSLRQLQNDSKEQDEDRLEGSESISLLQPKITDTNKMSFDEPLKALINAKLLEMMYTDHKDSLLKSPVELLMVIHSTLEEYVSSLELKEEKKKREVEGKKEKRKPNISQGLKIIDISENDEDEEEEKYYPEAIKNIAVIEDITEPISLIKELDGEEKDSIDKNNENDEDDEVETEEIIGLCFSLLLAISEDLSNPNDANKEDNEDEESEQDKINELRTLEAVLPQLNYVIKHGPEDLLKGKAISCRDNIIEVLQNYFPDEKYTEDSNDGNNTKATNVGNNENIKEKQKLLQDKKKLSKAIKLLDDPLVPIQANGMYLMKTLIDEKSSVVDNWQMICQIYLSKLKSEDSFIYLNAVKGLFALCDTYGTNVINYLVSIYIGVVPSKLSVESNTKEKIEINETYAKSVIKSMTVDENLRLGEVLLRTVQRLGKTLNGELANKIAGCMIRVVNNERGKGDYSDLLRMSAMSILGASFEANGIGLVNNWLSDSLDCSLGIIQMEVTIQEATLPRKSSNLFNSNSSEKEEQNTKTDEEIKLDNEQVTKEFSQSGKVLMRRASISLLGSIFKSLPSISLIPEFYQSKINTQLEIASHDSDPLIRSHAMTVMNIVNDLSVS